MTIVEKQQKTHISIWGSMKSFGKEDHVLYNNLWTITTDSSPDWDLVGRPRFVILRITGLIKDEFGKP